MQRGQRKRGKAKRRSIEGEETQRPSAKQVNGVSYWKEKKGVGMRVEAEGKKEMIAKAGEGQREKKM